MKKLLSKFSLKQGLTCYFHSIMTQKVQFFVTSTYHEGPNCLRTVLDKEKSTYVDKDPHMGRRKKKGSNMTHYLLQKSITLFDPKYCL